MDAVNSRRAVELLERARAGGVGGVSALPRPCTAHGATSGDGGGSGGAACLSFSSGGGAGAAAAAAAYCPLHAARQGLTAPSTDKALATYCGNCFELFGNAGGRATPHHCHVCGAVVCGGCGDYLLDKSVAAPLAKATTSAFGHMLGAVLHQAGDRRTCIDCAAALHPSLTRKRSLHPTLTTSPHVPLDVVFVFDATASMGAHIDLVEEQIDNIVEDVHRHHLIDLRCAGVAYRDHAYGARLVNVIPFQNHHHKFRRLIDHVRALSTHGNDIPEAMAAGLGVAQALTWRPLAAKAILVFTDAPPHGAAAPGVHDLFPNGDPTGLDPTACVRSLHTDGVAVYTIGVEPDAAQNGADRTLRTLAAVGGGLFVQLQPYDHERLHHYIAAALCDLVLKAACAQELHDAAAACGLSDWTQLDEGQRVRINHRVATRLKTRNMPQFQLAGGQDGVDVRGVHWDYLSDTGVAVYVDGVAQRPPAVVAYSGVSSSAPVPSGPSSGYASYATASQPPRPSPMLYTAQAATTTPYAPATNTFYPSAATPMGNAAPYGAAGPQQPSYNPFAVSPANPYGAPGYPPNPGFAPSPAPAPAFFSGTASGAASSSYGAPTASALAAGPSAPAWAPPQSKQAEAGDVPADGRPPPPAYSWDT